jgi:hypothetical protein
MKKALFIIVGIVFAFFLIFMIGVAYFAAQYEEPINQKAYNDKFDKFSGFIIENTDSLQVSQSIDSLDVFIKTYDTIGYSKTQKEQYLFVSEKLQDKQDWKDNLTVQRRVNHATYYDGSNLDLVEAVKKNLNDPDSFEHV